MHQASSREIVLVQLEPFELILPPLCSVFGSIPATPHHRFAHSGLHVGNEVATITQAVCVTPQPDPAALVD